MKVKKLVKFTLFALFMFLLTFSQALFAQNITVATIKKPAVLVGQWQMISKVKAGIKTELKSDFIFEFSPDATYLYMERLPIQGSSATGNIYYTHKIIEKGKWRHSHPESLVLLKGYNFASKKKTDNDLDNIISFNLNNKNKKLFSVKKFEGRDTVEYFYKKISDNYTFLANTK